MHAVRFELRRVPWPTLIARSPKHRQGCHQITAREAPRLHSPLPLAGTVYADPYPGFVQGANPVICKYGYKPVLSKDLGETPEQRLWREAMEFQELYSFENFIDNDVRSPTRRRQSRQQGGLFRLTRSGTTDSMSLMLPNRRNVRSAPCFVNVG